MSMQGLPGVSRLDVDDDVIYFDYGQHENNRIHFGSSQIVDWIELDLKSVPLKNAVGRFGNPDAVLIGMSSGGCIFDVFFTGLGLTLEGRCEASHWKSGGDVAASSSISTAYLTESQMPVAAALMLFFGDARGRELQGQVARWSGYGHYP